MSYQLHLEVKVTMTTEIEHKLKLRHLTLNDYDTIRNVSDRVYKSVATVPWPEETFRRLIETFPEGQVCIEDHGKPVAVAFSLVIDFSLFGDSHSYAQITADGKYTTHDPEGDYLYGIEVIVDPEYQGMRLGRRLYDARK
jgi:ribosomal protein S18 acetylase RimI-like enzyme